MKNAILKDDGNVLEIDVSTKRFLETSTLINKIDWVRFRKTHFGRVYASIIGEKSHVMFNVGNDVKRLDAFVFNTDKVVYHKNHNLLDNRIENLTEDVVEYPFNIKKIKLPPKKRVYIKQERLIDTNIILEDNGDWLLIDISTKTYHDATMKVDKTDWLRYITQYSNKVRAGCCGGGMVASFKHKNIKYAFHRFVLETALYVDHINHATLDNRRSNLREATPSQNSCNSVMSRANTSGVIGVSFNRSTEKWIACITKDRKSIRLGSFRYLKDAAAAREKAEKELFGEFRLDEETLSRNHNVYGELITRL